MAEDRYIIERDERDIGGGCTVVATFETWQVANKAWNLLEPDDDERIFLWLLRVHNGEPNHLNTTVIDCKVK
jgi:hypothetical protein